MRRLYPHPRRDRRLVERERRRQTHDTRGDPDPPPRLILPRQGEVAPKATEGADAELPLTSPPSVHAWQAQAPTRPYPDDSFISTSPPTISTAATTRIGVTASPSTSAPTRNAPTAPTPVHTV